MGQEPRKASSLLKLRAKETDCPLETPEGTRVLSLTVDPQNSNRINLRCFVPLHLW